MKNLKKIFRNLKYLKGIYRRSRYIGFSNLIKEWWKYNNRYFKFPKQIGKSSSFYYKLFVFHNYLRIIFYLPEIKNDKLLKIIPKYFAKNILAEITNPPAEKEKLVNKITFYRILEDNNIPYPEIYFYRDNGSFYTLFGEKLQNVSDYFGKELFVKALGGSSGAGTNKIVFTNNYCKENSENLIFQKLITSEQSIKELAPVNATATLRINSYLDKKDNLEICSAFIKLPIKGAVSDNMETGSIGVEVDFNEGILKGEGMTVKGILDEKGNKILKHPLSEKEFSNFNLPYWHDVVNMLLRLHKIFYDLKFIGWDIAITDKGPIVIEGNSVGDVLFEQLISEAYFDKKYIQENVKSNAQ